MCSWGSPTATVIGHAGASPLGTQRVSQEKAGRVHELHDEERDDGDGNGDVGLVGGRFVRGKRGVARNKERIRYI